MITIKYFFDEYSEFHRNPQGAVRHGDGLTLRLLLENGAAPHVAAVFCEDGGDTHETRMNFAGVKGQYDVFECVITPMFPALCWVYFRVTAQGSGFIIDRSGLRTEPDSPFQITVYGRDFKTPDWFKGGVMYHIFVDRFHHAGDAPNLRPGSVYREDWGGMPHFWPDEHGIIHNNDFFGGNLAGIIEKLPYLEEMGVTCLYLSPIFEAASSHKYDTGDYLKIDPGFGDEEIFKELISKAMERGIRVICDGVFNHVGMDSRYFNRYGNYDSLGAFQSRESPYIDWFNFIDWNQHYESWWGISLLPTTSKSSESYKKFITGKGGVLEYWMERGLAGWRLDVVDELPDSFLYPLCDAVKGKDTDALIIGEVWEDASNKVAYGKRRKYLLGGQLDSVMNYPLRNAIIAYVRDGDARTLAETMGSLRMNYPKPVLDSLMNILGTHDSARILTALGGEGLPHDREGMSHYRLSEERRALAKKRLKIASALQFTLPGVPCVYYGDETGMEGCTDPFNRYCYPWGREDGELLEWYRKLSLIRKNIPELKDGPYALIAARDGVFAFSRGRGVIVAANVSDKEARLDIGGAFRDHITGRTVESCVVQPGTVAVYTSR